MIDRVKVTISLPPEYLRVVKGVAADQYDGNVSMVVRRALETSPVTKSSFRLPTKATKASR